MADVNLTVSADIGDLRRQLESIPGITAEQARLMVAELDRGYKRAEKAAASAAKATRAAMKQAEEATRKASEAGKELGDKFGHVGSSAGKLAGALDLLAPGLGSVGQGIADLADVGEVAAGSIGSFAAPALGALAAAAVLALPVIMHLNAEMAAEAQYAETMGQAHAYVRRELELQRTAALDLAVATGLMTVAARDEADIRRQSAQRLGEYLEGLTKTSAETLAFENKVTAVTSAMSTLATVALAPVAPVLLLAEALGASVPSIEQLGKKLTDYIGLTGNYVKAQETAAKATKETTEETKRTRDADIAAMYAKGKHTGASRALTVTLKEEKVQMDALEAAQRTIEQARTAELTESQKLTEQLGKLSAQRAELAAAGKLTPELAAQSAEAEIALAKMVADARIEEDLRALEAAEAYEKAQFDERRRLADEELAATKEYWARRQEIATQAQDVVAAYTQFALDQSVQGYEDALAAQDALGKKATDAEKKRAAEEVAEKRKQAMIAFLIDKAAKLAQALTATALATINALSMPPAPNYIAAGLAAAGGAVQVATIAAARPSFHSGGMADFTPDEASAVIRRGEAVLSPQGRRALGDDTIRAANAGMSSGQTIVVQQVYRHRVFDSFVTDNLRTRGPLARALGSGARVGQRS
jgi:hypothetical protein